MGAHRSRHQSRRFIPRSPGNSYTKDIELLGNYKESATLLPTAAFFLRMPLQPARNLIQAGAAVTLHQLQSRLISIRNMNFVVALS